MKSEASARSSPGRVTAVGGSAADESALEHISRRESKELVLAISGPVGSGQAAVVDELGRLLKGMGYETEHLKLSKLIESLIDKEVVKPSKPAGSEPRVTRLQDAGNQLRKKYGEAVLAELAITQIASKRLSKQGEVVASGGQPPKKVAWIVDQLKNPAEAALLARVYGNLFYLIGVYSNEEHRLERLRDDQRFDDGVARGVMQRDRDENLAHGQRLEKTLQQAHYFIRSSSGDALGISSQCRRLIELIHGRNGLTPTVHESGMYAAYSASLKSACLSRQVGASIVSRHGVVIATGCNDVPKSGGGLYVSTDSPDHRCFNKGRCFNDRHKQKIQDEIEAHLESAGLGLAGDQVKKIAAELRQYTRIKDLIEFSRSVHAEMDAIVSVARLGGVSLVGCSLYTTTFPCHNCARHIVASGITHVYYIEPYEKSLARELHGEDIAFEDKDGESGAGKVRFIHFEGVAPARYHQFFQAPDGRKNKGGEAVPYPRGEGKVAPQLLDSYIDYEKKVTEILSGKGLVSD